MKKNTYNRFLMYLSILFIISLYQINVSANPNNSFNSLTNNGDTDSIICKYYDNTSRKYVYKSLNIENIQEVNYQNKGIQIRPSSNLISDGIIEYVQPDYKRKIHSIDKVKNGWGMDKTGLNIVANKLKDKKEEVVVAIIDTGVDMTHELLRDRLVKGYDFINHDDVADDQNGHGTHVAGIVAANSPNNVKIMPIRVMDQNGYGYDSVIALGIYYAVERGVNVINLSLGGVGYSKYLDEALNYAIENDVTVVVSAGNECEDVSKFFPASKEEIIVVSSINEHNDVSLFSNYGSTIDICAPGNDIYSSVIGNGYDYMSGTSMACPFISAAVALIKLEDVNRSPKEVEEVLNIYTEDLGNKGCDRVFGNGLINFKHYFTQDESFKIISPTDNIECYDRINIKYYSKGHVADEILFYLNEELVDRVVIDSEGYNNYSLKFNDKDFITYTLKIVLSTSNGVKYIHQIELNYLSYNTSFLIYDINYQKVTDFDLQIYGIKDSHIRLLDRVKSDDNGLGYTTLSPELFSQYDNIVAITGGKQWDNVNIPIYAKNIISTGHKEFKPNNIQSITITDYNILPYQMQIYPSINNHIVNQVFPITKDVTSGVPFYVERGNHTMSINLMGSNSGNFLYRLAGEGINTITLPKNPPKVIYKINDKITSYYCYDIVNDYEYLSYFDSEMSFGKRPYLSYSYNPGIYKFHINKMISDDPLININFGNIKKLVTNKEYQISVGNKLENSFIIDYVNSNPQVITLINDEFGNTLKHSIFPSTLGLDYIYHTVLIDDNDNVYEAKENNNNLYYGYDEEIFTWENVPDGEYTLKIIYKDILNDFFDIKNNSIRVNVIGGKFSLGADNSKPIITKKFKEYYKVKPFTMFKINLKTLFKDKENDQLYYTINKGYIYNDMYYYQTGENEFANIKITAYDFKGGSRTVEFKLITKDTIEMNPETKLNFIDWAQKELQIEFIIRDNILHKILNWIKNLMKNITTVFKLIYH